MNNRFLILAIMASIVGTTLMSLSTHKTSGNTSAIKIDADYQFHKLDTAILPIEQHSFKVCDVKMTKDKIKGQATKDVLASIIRTDWQMANDPKKPVPILLCSSKGQEEQLISAGGNPFASAVYMAYAQHRSLSLSPDMVWLLIAQGFALHVNQNAEKLRKLFVDHEGQITIEVERGSYHPGSVDWWQGIFPEFSEKIGKNTKGEVMEMVTPKFSTTGFAEKSAYEITLMDAMSAYFEYKISITCGIPEITIEGSPEDWAKIEKRLDQLEGYDLDWWVDDLRPIIKEFKLASEGKANAKFWKDIFAEESVNVVCGSETYYKGWLFKFFPYLKNGVDEKGDVSYVQNGLLLQKEKNADNGLSFDMGDLPNGLSKAKVLLDNNGALSILYFNAGFIGVEQDAKTMALRPSIQWFVIDTQLQPDAKELAKSGK